MKKISIICIAIISMTIISCKENAATKIKSVNLESAKERDAIINLGPAIIEFDKTEFDFGEVNEGEVIKGIFKISNIGKVDLLISDAKASCGCTIPIWPKEAIKPGESADLTFSFNTRRRGGNNNKSITLFTNTEEGVEVLRVKGYVIPDGKTVKRKTVNF